MRLLFDEQLSEALVRNLANIFPDALQVRLLDCGGASDPDVWELAREHGCVLVTKDGDFHRLSLLRGAPPKVVWLRIGSKVAELAAHRPRMSRSIWRLVSSHDSTGSVPASSPAVQMDQKLVLLADFKTCLEVEVTPVHWNDRLANSQN